VTREVWLRNIPKKVRVVVTEGVKGPIILVSTDLSLTAAQIIEIYAARFSLEIAIRDLKQHFGFEDYQATTTTPEGATLLHCFLHLEIDVAARERIHMVGRCGAKGNKGVHVQFCTRKAGIETVCHQADFFKFRTEPGL